MVGKAEVVVGAKVDEIAPRNPDMRALLLGLKSDGAAEANVPVLCSSADQARAMFGQDSMLAAMVEQFRAGNLFTELWCAPLAEPAAGVAAVQTITFIFAVLIVAFNLIADILYGILDPRIRYD